MSSKKLFLLVFLQLNTVSGCASPVPVSSTPPEAGTLIPNPTMESISAPENIYDWYLLRPMQKAGQKRCAWGAYAPHAHRFCRLFKCRLSRYYDCYFTDLIHKENNLCSIEQLEAILRVDVKEPDIKDSQLDFVTAFWNGPSDPDKFNGAGLIYSCPDNECDLIFIQYPLFSIDYKGKIEWGKTPRSAIETVDLTESTGEYVKGRFFQEKAGQPEIWSTGLETQMLVWVIDDVLFSITVNGNSSKDPLGKQDLVEFADSMK